MEYIIQDKLNRELGASKKGRYVEALVVPRNDIWTCWICGSLTGLKEQEV
jgi:hypothetical protein